MQNQLHEVVNERSNKFFSSMQILVTDSTFAQVSQTSGTFQCEVTELAGPLSECQ